MEGWVGLESFVRVPASQHHFAITLHSGLSMQSVFGALTAQSNLACDVLLFSTKFFNRHIAENERTCTFSTTQLNTLQHCELQRIKYVLQFVPCTAAPPPHCHISRETRLCRSWTRVHLSRPNPIQSSLVQSNPWMDPIHVQLWCMRTQQRHAQQQRRMRSTRPLRSIGQRLERDFTGLLTPGLYGSVETGRPVLWTGGAVWPAN